MPALTVAGHQKNSQETTLISYQIRRRSSAEAAGPPRRSRRSRATSTPPTLELVRCTSFILLQHLALIFSRTLRLSRAIVDFLKIVGTRANRVKNNLWAETTYVLCLCLICHSGIYRFISLGAAEHVRYCRRDVQLSSQKESFRFLVDG
jgi:hypothetical protein